MTCEHEKLEEGKVSRIGNQRWRCLDCGAQKIVKLDHLRIWCTKYGQDAGTIIRALLV